MVRIIIKPVGAFGGSAFRAVERSGARVAIQESKNGARWRDIAACTLGEFYDRAYELGVFESYGQNPASLWKIAESLVSGVR